MARHRRPKIVGTSNTRVRGVANPERARAEAERRRSGAAGTHGDRRYRRSRTRQGQLSRALRDF